MILVSAEFALLSVGLVFTADAYQVKDEVKNQALSLLRSRRKNTGFFEESRDDNFERECIQELCSGEELREIYPDNAVERKLKWEQLTKMCYINKCDAQGTRICIQTWNHRKCQCNPGWQGDICDQDVDECATGAAVCQENSFCSNLIGSYECVCNSNYRPETQADGSVVCVENVKSCKDTCIGANKYCDAADQCVCSEGFLDSGDGNCVDDNECEGDPCLEDKSNRVCVNNEGSFSCECKFGYETHVSGDYCVDINDCSNLEVCGEGSCIDQVGGYTCDCFDGYEYVNNTCENINECEGPSSPCEAGDQCFDLKPSDSSLATPYICCPAGTTEYDALNGDCVPGIVDRCESVVCGPAQTCNDGICFCDNVYQQLSDVGTCVDVDECANLIHTCLDTQVCRNLDSAGYECDCKQGFNKVGDECVPSGNGSEGGSTDPVTTEPAPTFAPTTTTVVTDEPEPETEEPVTEVPTYCPKGFEMASVDRSGRQGCVDIDECQTDNGGCRHPNGMCLNYYGSNMCYGTLEEEKLICHHYHEDADNINGYVCRCYEGYSLCHDEITCVADDRITFSSDNSAACGEGQVSYLGICYSLSEDVASYDVASLDCESQGGQLAVVNSREVWWWLGMMIDFGTKPFYVSNDSDPSISGANIHVVQDGGSNYLVNIVPSMNAVPPQWNSVSGDEAHRYWCEF